MTPMQKILLHRSQPAHSSRTYGDRRDHRIDLVRAQILVAMGHKLGDQSVGLPDQSEVRATRLCHSMPLTTEDPTNAFRPDYGRITHYRSAGGLGIPFGCWQRVQWRCGQSVLRFDAVKVTARGRTLPRISGPYGTCLQEFRIRGVKTNIPFLIQMVSNEIFLEGKAYTRLIDTSPKPIRIQATQGSRDAHSEILGEHDR